MPDESFSVRHGILSSQSPIKEDAPESLRIGLRQVLHELGYQTPKQQRALICKAWRVAPDASNWSDYPNVEDEVVWLLTSVSWNEFYDRLERLPTFLRDGADMVFRDRVTTLLAEENIGYHFDDDKIVTTGTIQFEEAITAARAALQDARFAEPRRQFERGLDFRSNRPPDWGNAIKEAANSVEAVLQVIYNRPSVSLPTIVKDDFPSALPGNVRNLFKSLYGLGSGTVGARHAAVGGNAPTAARADLALHVAAALHGFAIAELDSMQNPTA